MVILYVLASIIAISALVFFLRIAVKRISFSIRLKSLCKDNKFGFLATKKLWFLGWMRGKKCDFLVETPECVYSVKFIGSWTRRNPFNFIDDEHYSVRNLFFQFSAAAKDVPYDVKHKSRYDFTSFVPKNWDGKRICPIILMNPVSGVVTYSSEGSLQPVSNGDRVAEGFFHTASSFLETLGNL